MNSVKYVGLDVHQSTISVAVLNAEGRLVMQSVIATQAAAILDFIAGQRGTLQVTFEEGTHAAWLYDLLVRRVARLVVCNPRQNALLKSGNKSDPIDARKLAELLRAGMLSPVYHGENSTGGLQQLVASYTALTQDTTRVMARIKALYRSQAIACAGKKPLGKRHRQQWLEKLTAAGQRQRAEWLYAELDAVQGLRRQARQALVAENRKHAGREAVAHDAVSRSAARGGAAGQGANPVSLSQQASVLGLLRAGAGDAQQRRLCDPKWRGGTPPASAVHPRIELEP